MCVMHCGYLWHMMEDRHGRRRIDWEKKRTFQPHERVLFSPDGFNNKFSSSFKKKHFFSNRGQGGDTTKLRLSIAVGVSIFFLVYYKV